MTLTKFKSSKLGSGVLNNVRGSKHKNPVIQEEPELTESDLESEGEADYIAGASAALKAANIERWSSLN